MSISGDQIHCLEGLDTGVPVGFIMQMPGQGKAVHYPVETLHSFYPQGHYPVVHKAGDGGSSYGLPDIQVCLPDSVIANHALLIGRTGVGKSTLIKNVVNHRLQEKARGVSNGAIVVIAPHADLVEDILRIVPLEIADKVRLLDFGGTERVPAINLMDPGVFTDRDQCVGTIILTLRGVSDSWGARLQDILDRSLKAIYEYNCHQDTERSGMLTMVDVLQLLEDGEVVLDGSTERVEQTPFQQHVLSRVNDPDLVRWFKQFQEWPRDTRVEALCPVVSCISGYVGNARAKVVLGQRESALVLSDVLEEEQVLLVTTASGDIGRGPAALLGGAIVSLIESAVRDQAKLPLADRKQCLLIADEFQTIAGTDWESLLVGTRQYGCSILLATQSLARLDTPEWKLKDGVLGSCGCLISYQVSSADAQIISGEMGRQWVTEDDLVRVAPYTCYAKINLATNLVSTFSMRTLPPPEVGQDPTAAMVAIESGMYQYTCALDEALARITAERLDVLSQC